VSQVGANFLPAVEAALRTELGEFRKPRDSHQLASWLRSVGCLRESAEVDGNEQLFEEAVAWFQEQLKNR